MGKSASAPQAPDYMGLMNQQANIDKNAFNYQLQASRYDTSNPWGSTSWSFEPGAAAPAPAPAASPAPAQSAGQVASNLYGYNPEYGGSDGRDSMPMPAGQGGYSPAPAAGSTSYSGPDFSNGGKWTQKQTLNPQMQGILDSLMGQAGSAVSNPLSFDGLPPAYGQEAADAYYNKATRYLQPAWEQDRRQLEARLAEQGFVPGTPGYDSAMSSLNRSQDMARGQAADSAVLGGTETGLKTRQQMLSELLTQRTLPLSLLQAFSSGAQIPTSGGGMPGLKTPDLVGAANQQYQAGLDKYNTDVASDNQMFGTLGNMGLAGLMYFSDSRLKEDISYTGEEHNGIPVVTFRYKGRPESYRGVLAEDVLARKPHAVHQHESGYLAVDYGAL